VWTPRIAALGLADRARPAEPVTSGAQVEQVTDEGVWRITRPRLPAEIPRSR